MKKEVSLEEYLLSDVYKHPDIYDPNSEFVIWWKDHLREMKNKEEIWLKELIEEKTYENQGLNPPWCYKKY